MNRSTIGELEELLLLAIASLTPEAYGFAIKALVLERAGRDVNLSAVHAALYRLEKKGYLKSRFGASTNKRGGKKKKYFDLTSSGVSAIKSTREIRNSLWDTVSPSVIDIS